MRKDFGKEAEVNKIIRYLTEGGFFVKWHHDNTRMRRKSEVSFAISSLLKMDRLWLVFGVAGIGIILAILSFCLEVIVHRMIYERNDRRWIWINLEQICDGYRHRFRDLTK